MLACFLSHSLHAACISACGTLNTTPSLLTHSTVKKFKPLISCFSASFNTFKQFRLAQKVTGMSLLAATGYVAYRFFNYVWYTSNKSVQALINHNQETYTRALAYQPLIDILARSHKQHLKVPESYSQGDENILNELIPTINKPYTTFMHDLNRILQTLTLDKAKTQITLKKLILNHESSFEQKTPYRDLENGLRQLSALELNLNVLKDYMVHYQKYIELYEHTLALDATLAQIAPYAQMIHELDTRYQNISQVHITTIAIDETILNQFAATNPDMGTTIQALESIIRSLESKRNIINAGLQHIQYPYQKIRESLTHAEYQIPYLRALKDFLIHHKDYFAFYDQEIALITRYGNGSEPLPLPSGSLYPHVEIVSQLERDLASFNPIKQSIATKYPSRGGELGMIEYMLRQQIATIVGSQIYQEELRRRKDDEHKQAMLLEQRRMAAAQEQQAHEAQQTRILQQEILLAQNQHTQEMVTFNGHIRTLIDHLNESRWSLKKLSGDTNPMIVADNLEQLARTVRNVYRTHAH